MTIWVIGEASSVHVQRWVFYLVSRGHQVTVWSIVAGSLEGAVVRAPEVVKWMPRKFRFACLVFILRAALRESRPDVVNAHYATSYGLVAMLAGARPRVLTAWGTDVLVHRPGSLRASIALTVLRDADLVVSVANHMTRRLVQGFGVSPNKIVTAPFGVDVDAQPTGLADKDFDVISTRSLEASYRVDLLIEAASLLPSLQILIVGSGSYRPALVRRVISAGLERRVSFIGQLSPEDVLAHLARSRVFVSTSPTDGNNVSLNEAMLCGAFPVVVASPASAEWIRDGWNGLIVESHAAALAGGIARALADPELRARAVERNYAIVRDRANRDRNFALVLVRIGALI